jgi:hypothetical protein
MGNYNNMVGVNHASRLPPLFAVDVTVLLLDRKWIRKGARGRLEEDAVFGAIGSVLVLVPLKVRFHASPPLRSSEM